MTRRHTPEALNPVLIFTGRSAANDLRTDYFAMANEWDVGSLDAPQYIPAGSMEMPAGITVGIQRVTSREWTVA